jgi:peptidoglycan/xylan/chitin deacetylase (PgdA/CDA1 family)
MRPLPILLYHSVDDEPAKDVARWSVTPRQFAEHMAVLRHGGWNTLTLSELLLLRDTGASWPADSVAVTFDDGFEDVLSRAMPAMDGMVATAYVTSGWLRDRATDGAGAPGRMLSSPQLAEIASGGWEVGVHGHRHVALDAVSRAVAGRDIEDSKHLVEDALGAPTKSFAYPYGYHDKAVQHLVRGAGFDHAVGVKNTHSHTQDDRWGIARITVERHMTATWLEQTLTQPAPRTAVGNERLRTVGWRQVRRARAALTGTST